jgi:hypothetical protein
VTGAPKATAYVRTIERREGDVFYAKLKLPDGTQPQRRLGKVWKKRTRPPDGYLTKGMAQARLAAMLAGDDPLVNLTPTRVTFGQACDDWLDYIEHDRKRRPTTVRGYRNTVSCYLRPAFSDSTPIDDIRRPRWTPTVSGLCARPSCRRERSTCRSCCCTGSSSARSGCTGCPATPKRAQNGSLGGAQATSRCSTPGDVALLVSKAENARDAALFTFAAFTGLQLGEFAGAPLVLRRLRQADRPRSPLVGSRSKHDAADKLTALVGASADDWRAGARALPDPA